jgi:hypothetical protein
MLTILLTCKVVGLHTTPEHTVTELLDNDARRTALQPQFLLLSSNSCGFTNCALDGNRISDVCT